MPRFWNVYRSSGHAQVGDTVRLTGNRSGPLYRIVGTQGSDSDGVPYVRLRPEAEAGAAAADGREKVVLVTAVERAE